MLFRSVPASNFTSAFPDIGYRGIKHIFDMNKVKCMTKTIIQASDLKRDIEKLGITRHNTTIASIDAEAFYPSVRFKLVKKAVNFFAKGLKAEELTKINHCLDMIKFGMSNALVSFEGQHRECDGEKDPDEKC